MVGGPVNITLEIPDAKIIAPGDPPHSTLLTRMQLVGKNQMPPLARNEVDRAGVTLLEAWIKNLQAK